MWQRLVVGAGTLLLAAACNAEPGTPPNPGAGPVEESQAWSLEIVAEYPHDSSAYTQGLEFINGELWESTGQYGESSLRRTDFTTGEVLASVDLSEELFGEGITAVADNIWQLTWYAGRALRWGQDLTLTGEVSYSGHGWGLCFDGESLWRSDGSGLLHRHDPLGFEPLGSVQLADRRGPVTLLNELECVDGLIYANVYTQDEIIVLNPSEDRVVARIDASELRRRMLASGASPTELQRAEVLNGIAYHRQRESFFLTGKYWPSMFEVRFVPDATNEESKDD